jgi:hypothetical protein
MAPPSQHPLHVNFKHFTNPMVHPVMGKTILINKQLMNNPAMAEVWQMVFGKDFGGMAQGDNKTRYKETSVLFVMTHNQIAHALAAKILFNFVKPIVDYRPQKDDPNQICITAMGNLINYNGELSAQTADINTAKLHLNSIVGMPHAKYMRPDI